MEMREPETLRKKKEAPPSDSSSSNSSGLWNGLVIVAIIAVVIGKAIKYIDKSNQSRQPARTYYYNDPLPRPQPWDQFHSPPSGPPPINNWPSGPSPIDY